MKKLKSILAVTATSIFLASCDAQEKIKVSFAEKDFVEESTIIRDREVKYYSRVLYDFDKNKKLSLTQKLLEQTEKLTSKEDFLCRTYFEKLGYDVMIVDKFGNPDLMQEKNMKEVYGKKYFILNEEYLKLNEKGDLILAPILDKIKRMSYEEIWNNSKSIYDGADPKNKVYVINTNEGNQFVFRVLEVKNRKVELEIYKIKEARQ